jgi:Dolichyl-phosphate-mannose-protein mannosyltransferase
MTRLTVRAACSASLIIGLFFVFVWAPHPWGWAGFDQYYDLGQLLARGSPFPTIDVPWGYAYFLAPFYRLFGDRPWVPLLVQVALNATMPLLTFRVARQLFDDRVAVVAALLTGLVSFNTVYASTQSSDAVCNVLFLASVLVFISAQKTASLRMYAAAGALFGLAPQFRPNLILIPVLLAVFTVATAPSPIRAVRDAAILVAASALMLTPWMVRNHRLTGEILPTSTHGGVQLWYGSLQTGRYLQSRAHNPRSVFETGPFSYTSLDRVPLIVTARLAPCAKASLPLVITYWTDRDPIRHTVTATANDQDEFQAQIPAQPAPTTYYYYLKGIEGSERSAHVFFVSTDHLGDLDRHGDLLDAFDVVRLMREAAWSEPVAFADRLDLDGDGRLSGSDAATAAGILAGYSDERHRSGPPPRFSANKTSATVAFDDGSAITVERQWSGRITDVEFVGESAAAVLHASVPFSLLRSAHDDRAGCHAVAFLGVNTVFYREQTHSMRRYIALALDNIRRDPLAYAESVVYRAARVFFIEGSDDTHTTHQFTGGGRIYRAAFWLSMVLLVLALVGIGYARARGSAIALPLLLIAYIPATLAFMLTNMRYSITVQPLLFMFVSVTIVTVLERSGRWQPHAPIHATAARYREGMQTAHRP